MDKEFNKKDMLATFLSLANKERNNVAEFIANKVEKTVDELIDEAKPFVEKNKDAACYSFGFIYAAFISESTPEEIPMLSEISVEICEALGLSIKW